MQVRLAIADDVAVARVERVVAQVIGEQAGLRLATLTTIDGAVRAEEFGVEFDALRREEGADEVLRFAESGFRGMSAVPSPSWLLTSTKR